MPCMFQVTFNMTWIERFSDPEYTVSPVSRQIEELSLVRWITH